MTASASIAIATIFDLLVWYYAKNLVIFDKKKEDAKGEKGEDEGDANGLVTVKNNNGL